MEVLLGDAAEHHPDDERDARDIREQQHVPDEAEDSRDDDIGELAADGEGTEDRRRQHDGDENRRRNSGNRGQSIRQEQAEGGGEEVRQHERDDDDEDDVQPVAEKQGAGVSPCSRNAPRSTAIDAEPGIPSASVGISEPPSLASFAASLAMTPPTSPVP